MEANPIKSPVSTTPGIVRILLSRSDGFFIIPKSTSGLLNTGSGQFLQDGFNKGALSPIAAGGGVGKLTGLLS